MTAGWSDRLRTDVAERLERDIRRHRLVFADVNSPLADVVPDVNGEAIPYTSLLSDWRPTDEMRVLVVTQLGEILRTPPLAPQLLCRLRERVHALLDEVAVCLASRAPRIAY